MKSVLKRTLLWLSLLVPCCAGAHASVPEPLIVLSERSASYDTLHQSLNRYNGQTLPAVTPDALSGQALERLLVAIGARACQSVIDTAGPESRVLCIYLPAQTFDELSAATKGQTLLAQQRLSAVFLDQPLARQIRLARLLKPEARTLGTVVGSESTAQAEAFSAEAQAQQLEPVIARLGPDDNPVQILTPVIERSDLFLPLPDRSVFNRAAARWILYITLRSGVPLIGFSQKYADAGAVVALHSTNDEIARHGAELILGARKAITLPTPAYPRYFSVSVNPTAARNLKLPPLNPDLLRQQLQQQEAPE